VRFRFALSYPQRLLFFASPWNVAKFLSSISSHLSPTWLPSCIMAFFRIIELRSFSTSTSRCRRFRSCAGKKECPGGLPLHDYGNLYFNGRNKMMAKKRPQHAEICVLRVAPNVLDLPGAIIADQNASSQYVLFLPSPAGLKKLLHSEVFARCWMSRRPN
jgi:hypothetical protein